MIEIEYVNGGGSGYTKLEVPGDDIVKVLGTVQQLMGLEVKRDLRYEAMRRNFNAGLRGHDLEQAIFEEMRRSGIPQRAGPKRVTTDESGAEQSAVPNPEDRQKHARQGVAVGGLRENPRELPKRSDAAPDEAAKDCRQPTEPEEGGRTQRASGAARPAGVRDASREAYEKLGLTGELSKQQRTILLAFEKNPGRSFTRQELAHETGLGINAVCGRVNELLEPPFERLTEVGRRRCQVTGNRVNALSMVKLAR